MLKVWTRQIIRIFKILAPHLLRKMKHNLVWFKISTCFSILVFTTTSKNMKKFVSKILENNRSGKPDTEEASHIEGCVNPNIQEKYNLTKKNYQ